jgi:excisionase family DNA binding protein
VQALEKSMITIVGSSIFPYSLKLTIGAGEMPEDIMTLREVAEYLKLAEKTAYRLAADGKIPGFKVGGSWRFRKAAIEDWIDQQTTKNRT